MESTDKKVNLNTHPISSKKTVITEKPKTKRIITETEKWTFSPEELLPTIQPFLTAPLFVSDSIKTKTHLFILQQVRNKINGYKAQDIEKKKYDPMAFVQESDVLELFKSTNLLCYYCQDPTLVLYEYVRDPKQWSLERLDNSMGHNTNNVVLSCLRCNLRRRCMHSDRYLKTKQMSTIIKLN